MLFITKILLLLLLLLNSDIVCGRQCSAPKQDSISDTNNSAKRIAKRVMSLILQHKHVEKS